MILPPQRTTVGSATSSSVDLDLPFVHSCSSLGNFIGGSVPFVLSVLWVPSGIAVRCSTCHYWASRFIHFLSTRLGVLIPLLVLPPQLLRTTIGSATSSSVDDLQFFSFAPSCFVGETVDRSLCTFRFSGYRQHCCAVLDLSLWASVSFISFRLDWAS
jgi:hypothetical protein